MKIKVFIAFAIFVLAAVLNFTVLQDDFSWDNLFGGEEAQIEAGYDLAAQRAKIAKFEMQIDTSFLNDEEKAVINKLIKAADLMTEIYMRQVSENNPAIRAEIAASDHPDRDLLLDMFDVHLGAWDTLDENRTFYGETPLPLGAAFYPADITKEEFEAWITAHPEDKAAFKSLYTVIRRDGENLIAIPFRDHYREWLEPAAALLREAAEITTNPSLKKFLLLRADSFLTDEYYESEIAWMDLEGTPIEVVIGPYEVYTDGLYNYKAAYEAFITLRDPEESRATEKYIKYLRDMEAHLPVEEHYKNFKRGFESPMGVVYQVRGGGDNTRGVQTIAFNLPNDEKIREEKGAKKIILNNVLGAKFEMILKPMATFVVVPEQAELLRREYFNLDSLFHELTHSIGPGNIVKDGVETTVNAELMELYSGIEEGKADATGAYNILYMMDLGELPIADKENFLATYFVSLLRSTRFGIDEAHGMGAAFQYSFYREAGAAVIDEETGLLRIDFPVLEQAISDLVAKLIIIEAEGDYDAAKAFLDKYVHLDEVALKGLASLGDIPVDIQPLYPDEIQ